MKNLKTMFLLAALFVVSAASANNETHISSSDFVNNDTDVCPWDSTDYEAFADTAVCVEESVIPTVAGVDLGDTRSNVREILINRFGEENLITDETDDITFYEVSLAGILFEYATFEFELCKGEYRLSSIMFYKSFNANASNEAKNFREKVYRKYQQKYNFETGVNDDKYRYYSSLLFEYDGDGSLSRAAEIAIGVFKGTANSGANKIYAGVNYDYYDAACE